MLLSLLKPLPPPPIKYQTGIQTRTKIHAHTEITQRIEHGTQQIQETREKNKRSGRRRKKLVKAKKIELKKKKEKPMNRYIFSYSTDIFS